MEVKSFWLAFIPLFVAIDVVGTVPLYLNLVRSVPVGQRNRTLLQASLTALVIAVVMVFGGKWIFKFLGIGIPDFRIAGGLILLILSIKDLSTSHESDAKTPLDPSSIGVVPLGIPLIVGPAALTTILISVDTFGRFLTLTSVLTNLFLALVVLMKAHHIEKLLTKNGAGAFAKFSSLLLAAIAVMMIRVGVAEAFRLPMF